MLLIEAVEKDFAEVVELANVAYRQTGEGASWNTESGIIEGSRLDESVLREDLAKAAGAALLLYRDEADGMLLGTVWVEPKDEGVWYLGLLTVRPAMQSAGVGRGLMEGAEAYAKQRGGVRIRMTVLSVRDELLAWYGRRGYVATGETAPFPYGDERFGKPARDDLFFVVVEKGI